MKVNTIPEKYCGKYISPHEMLNLLRKNEHNRIWILKQLSQLGIDIEILQDCPLHQLYRHCDQIIKSTYSVKYLGMNQNQMGIISRRIDPFKDSNFNLRDLPQCPYKVTKFFYPKPLKVGRKTQKQNGLTSENLQQQIKNAFMKKSITKKPLKEKKKHFSGSWMNSTIKMSASQLVLKQASDSTKDVQLSHSQKKLLKMKPKNVNIQLPQTISKWKNTTSYSGFLKSGLLLMNQPQI